MCAIMGKVIRFPRNAITETLLRSKRKQHKNERGTLKMKNFKLSWVAIYAIVSYAIIAVASDIFANKMLDLGGLTLAGGILLVPLSFSIRDLMHRCVGYDNAKKIVWATAFVNLAVAVLLILLDVLPSAIPGQQEAWNALMGSSWRIIVASFIAQLVADLSDTYIFEWFTRRMGDNKTWLRVGGSNLVSTFFDSVLFSMIAFLGVLPIEVIWASVFSSFLVKFVISEIATPIAYITNRVKYDNKE